MLLTAASYMYAFYNMLGIYLVKKNEGSPRNHGMEDLADSDFADLRQTQRVMSSNRCRAAQILVRV